MRKSIKRIAATLLAATMSLGLMTTAFADDIAPAEGETLYTIAGGAAVTPWAPTDTTNVLTQAKDVNGEDIEGVYSITFTAPAFDETAEWNSRFAVCAYNEDTLAGWARVLVGDPVASKLNNDEGAYGDMTQFHINVEAETEVTVYFDEATYAVVIRDAEGNAVPFTFGWCTYDAEEAYYTPEEYAEMDFDSYIASLVQADRANSLANLNVTALPNFVEMNEVLNSKIDGTYVEEEESTTVTEEESTTVKEEESTTVKEEESTTAKAEDTTTKKAEEATTTTAPATTAKNQPPKTGDAAPVALLLVLASAVAVVTVVAKKKEA